MKKLLYLLFAFLLVSCGGDDENAIEENNPDLNFQVNVTAVGIQGAQIAWEDPVGFENTDWVYRVVLENEVVSDGLNDLEYSFSNLEELTDYSGTVFAIGSNGLETFANFTFSTTINTILDGNLTLRTQAEIDSFFYTRILGNLTIDGQSINDLTPLNILTEVERNIKILNTSVVNLSGLENVTTENVNGSISNLEVINNPNLTNISALSTYLSNTNRLVLENNTSLNTLNNVQVPNAYNLSIINSPITDLSNFNNVIEFVGVHFDNIPASGLANFFTNVSAITGSLSLNNIQTNAMPYLSDVVSTVSFELRLSNIPLTNLNDFANCETLYQLSISNMPNLTNLEGLDNLKDVYEFGIGFNPALTSLDGITNFTGENTASNSIFLVIIENPSLTNYCAISSYLNNVTYAYDEISDDYFYYVYDNAYNPNRDEIKTPEGCSQ